MNKKYQYDHQYKAEALVAKGYNIPVMGPEFKLATAYVPYQVMGKVYEPWSGLMRGTIFPELYDPYVKLKRAEKED